MKTFAVIGLGKFGFHIAKGLAEQGASVIACDRDEEKVREISDFVHDAVILDSTDIKALKEAGVAAIDVAIVSIGENIESSILTVMALGELGIETVIAKAITPVHGQILTKIGASRVIYPEMEVGKRLVKTLLEHMHYETIDLSNTMKIVKLTVPNAFVGKKFMDVNFEKEYNVKLIAYKHEGVWHHKDMDLDITIARNDIMVLLGNIAEIEKVSKVL